MELMSQTLGIHCSGEGIKISNKKVEKLVNFREFKPNKAENSGRIQAKKSKNLAKIGKILGQKIGKFWKNIWEKIIFNAP